MLRHLLVLAPLFTAFSASSIPAHNLPISEMNIVADEETLHVEFMVNTAELALAAELDQNGDGRLAYAELAPHGEEIARRILNRLKFRLGHQPLQIAVCGILPGPNTHHLTVRAHYQVDARNAALSLQSQLFSIVPSSHVMQVTFRRPGRRHVARLSANAPEVQFPRHEPADHD